MRRAAWFAIGVVATLVVAMAVTEIPVATAGVESFLGMSVATTSSDPSEPAWNTGNLCSSITYGPGPGNVTCVSHISNSAVPLTYNFSAGKVQGGVVNVTIYGSNDCIYLNFHSFYTTLNIDLLGSGYACPLQSGKSSGSGGGAPNVLWAGGNWGNGNGCSHDSGWGSGWASPVEWGHSGKKCGPGVNIVVNSEGDILNLNQTELKSKCGGGDGFSDWGSWGHGKGYATNVTIYGTTTVVNAVQYKGTHGLNTTVTYIGTKPGFSVCPSGITYGRVHWTEVSYGSHNTFSTIFIDGTNIAHPPANYTYFTVPLAPPAGISYGYNNLYGNETTQTVPLGSCQYLAQ
jgi:hypothetical protein